MPRRPSRTATDPHRERLRFPTIAGVVVFLSALVATTAAGAVSVPPTGYAVHDFVTGLPTVPPPSFFAGIGPFGLAFDAANHLVVADGANGGLYSFGPAGSNAPVPISTGSVQAGLAFGTDGALYAALYQAANIDQIDPATGLLIRHLNPPGSPYPCVAYLATDPVSGDVFFGQPNSGGACPGGIGFTRIEHPSNPNPTFVTYAPVPNVSYIGLTFAPDGTLYTVQQGPVLACAVRIDGLESSAPPTVTTVACFANFGEFAGIDSITLSLRPHDPPTLFVAGPSGTITQIDQTTSVPTLTPIVTLPTRVDALTVGPDGCLYATQSTSIEKITNTDGTCSLAAAPVLPTLTLHPGGPSTERVGHQFTARATIRNTTASLPAQVTFTVTGANPLARTVTLNRDGTARLSYRGLHPGTDTITATATAGSIDLASLPTTVTWQFHK